MSGWSLNPDALAEKYKLKISRARETIAFAVFTRVVMRTPVDRGAARQNWLVTLNNPTYAYDKNKAKGGRVMSDGQKAINGAKGDDKIIMQNNMPYIEKLEYGGYGPNSPSGKTVGGFSKQAPHGMVGVTMQEFGGIVTDAIAGAR
jgi:hypothetical protein